MSIGSWLRRLLGLPPQGTHWCNLCRSEIPASHFAKGHAVVIAQRRYCKGCVEEITLRKQTKGSSGGWTLSGAEAHSSSTVHLP